MSETPVFTPKPSETPPWGIGTVLFWVVLIYGGLAITISPFREQNPALMIILSQFLLLLLWTILFRELALQYQVSIKPILGLSRVTQIQKLLKFTVLALLAMGVASSLLQAIATLLNLPLPQPYAQLPSDQRMALAVAAILFAPITEELVFRGFVQSTLIKFLHPLLAILCTTLIFLLFHITYYFAPLALIYVILMGLILGVCRYQSGSAVPGILAHAANNLIAAWMLL